MERVADGEMRAIPVSAPGITGRIWSPPGAGERALVVHDGPEYDRRAHLGRWAAEAVAAGSVPPFHLVLLEAGERNEAYSASAAYARALTGKVLPGLGFGAPVVGAGASLGALAMLHAQRREPERFAALFLQSGSFFQHRFDKQESGFARYRRILRFVSQVRRTPAGPGVPVVITCGADEENLANNISMASSLRAQGYDVTFAEVPGGHDWDAWRNAFDPYLTALLRRVWS
ncbi:alpha/beta hydrolase [Actinoplanes sp. CA-030573]|uniref:alpha/beta hydrolase n=1 Tax=Actinoplanes sp. CA-030573 TaxID=3239898 RepID=UPI003D8F47C9